MGTPPFTPRDQETHLDQLRQFAGGCIAGQPKESRARPRRK